LTSLAPPDRQIASYHGCSQICDIASQHEYCAAPLTVT
jgi:hypothetical protein